MADQQIKPPAPIHEGLQPLSQQKNLDAHQTAPPELKAFFKRHSSSFPDDLDELIDFEKYEASMPGLESISSDQVDKAFDALDQTGPFSTGWKEAIVYMSGKQADSRRQAFSFKQIPGLVIYPGLLPCKVQLQLLNRLLNRDLLNPAHQTNLHAHYDMLYPEEGQSWFSSVDATRELQPKDAAAHKPLSIKQALERKLRWMTLGGQYDWTNKQYPAEVPPEFPEDIASFIHGLFPDMEPQAAIVNVYSPGDKLNMHRDVSEEVDEGLVSISLGCSCIFIIGIEDEVTHKVQKVAIRLHSGDVLYMKGESRLAWHGVSRIEKGTCPVFLNKWPGKPFDDYGSWMGSKRINLNVRQMRKTAAKESQNHTEGSTIKASTFGGRWTLDENVQIINSFHRFHNDMSQDSLMHYIAVQTDLAEEALLAEQAPLVGQVIAEHVLAGQQLVVGQVLAVQSLSGESTFFVTLVSVQHEDVNDDGEEDEESEKDEDDEEDGEDDDYEDDEDEEDDDGEEYEEDKEDEENADNPLQIHNKQTPSNKEELEKMIINTIETQGYDEMFAFLAFNGIEVPQSSRNLNLREIINLAAELVFPKDDGEKKKRYPDEKCIPISNSDSESDSEVDVD